MADNKKKERYKTAMSRTRCRYVEKQTAFRSTRTRDILASGFPYHNFERNLMIVRTTTLSRTTLELRKSGVAASYAMTSARRSLTVKTVTTVRNLMIVSDDDITNILAPRTSDAAARMR
jgi:hypothetical protein